jgi:hypothetical protein
VHVVELSDHPGDMLDDAARRRVAAERRVEIDHLIEHDHAFHDKRRRARSR